MKDEQLKKITDDFLTLFKHNKKIKFNEHFFVEYYNYNDDYKDYGLIFYFLQPNIKNFFKKNIQINFLKISKRWSCFNTKYMYSINIPKDILNTDDAYIILQKLYDKYFKIIFNAKENEDKKEKIKKDKQQKNFFQLILNKIQEN